MVWRAWLQGHPFDLETLAELFPDGDVIVVHTDSDDYYVESSAFVDEDGRFDHEKAALTLKRLNGIARAIGSGFHPVQLTGGYTGPDGVIELPADRTIIRDKVSMIRTGADGALIPAPPSKGPDTHDSRRPIRTWLTRCV